MDRKQVPNQEVGALVQSAIDCSVDREIVGKMFLSFCIKVLLLAVFLNITISQWRRTIRFERYRRT